MKTIACNGVGLNFRRAGEGRDLILIHGLAANHAFWHLDVLLPLVREYSVTVYDLRGHGYSEMTPSGYTTADMAEDLHQLMDKLEIDDAELIGHSFGGGVALHYAALHPERVSSLVIADTRIHSLQPTNYQRDWPNHETALKRLREIGIEVPEDEPDSGIWLLEQLAQPEWRRAKEKLVGKQIDIPFCPWGGGSKSAERWLKLLSTTTARKDITSVNGPSLDDLQKIEQPVLAFYGEHSSLLPSFQGLKEHLIHCKTAIAEGAGHFFPASRPKQFIHEITHFLGSQVQPG